MLKQPTFILNTHIQPVNKSFNMKNLWVWTPQESVFAFPNTESNTQMPPLQDNQYSY